MSKKITFDVSVFLLICLAASFLSSCGYLGGEKIGARKLFPVSKNGKYGYIDRNGKMVVEPQFDRAYDFCEGLALVQFFERSNSLGSVE